MLSVGRDKGEVVRGEERTEEAGFKKSGGRISRGNQPSVLMVTVGATQHLPGLPTHLGRKEPAG